LLATVLSIDPLTDPRWEAFVEEHPQAGFFHSASWLEVVQRAYGYQPAHLAYQKGGSLRGILPLVLVNSRLTGKRLVSLPFSGPAGPVGSETAVEALVAAAVRRTADLGRTYLTIESRDDRAELHNSGFARHQPLVCSLLSGLGDASNTWMRKSSKRLRRYVSQARANGVSTRPSHDPSDLRAFYRLHTQTHRKFGLPPQPYSLFEEMWNVLKPGDRLWLFVTSRGSKVITAQLCFGFKDVFGALYVGIDYSSLRYHPVKLTDWTSIEFASSRGYKEFDFLQSDVSNAGLRWYKRSFGAVEVAVSRYSYPRAGGVTALKSELVHGQSALSRLARATIRRMPSPGLELLGRVVFKHMG
jgi:CelD/BcsL family acetyltransferase involved in cellulose biosynthesis